MKVLIVDDNHSVVETIADYLELEGISIDCAYHGEAALALVGEQHFDVIIMDIMMPKMDGITAVTKMREELFCQTPVLFLTAKDALDDKVAAFKAGGDDYLLKPFALQELLLRLYALNNRGPRQDIGELKFADICLNIRTDEVTRDNQPIKLSRIQCKILKVLLRKAPGIVSRQEVIDAVWGEDSPSSDALRSHIYGLRNAIDKGFDHSRLETIHGQGYRIKA
ncbi:response regulator transcription factor [Photobacterium aphoticum]|uniref:Chemotaxis protein CheY n=1 Tax=Photobacterium aphoticum TaxID=754436 RepID=A0A0J1GKK9_9GAMM|nr:response regulator transcription factor [Photobacterium aphoticum]KLV00228.1 chemotaxis protein CheY [Photobacterium aphoticum]PSU56597.1 DNA-binding response regulator [Photobacterium aphoticum]GHA55915.1 DNA-binding response regulator [Photobacterium aphoticum]